jgi:hypothetical protein
MKVKFLIFNFLFLTVLLSCKSNFEPVSFNTYPPAILIDDKNFTIQIPAEAGRKNNKDPFAVILQKYGFSGNGQSIEQVVKHNIRYKKVKYNSEGDCFRAEFADKPDMDEFILLIQPMLQEEELHKWTFNARHILIKE